MANTNSSFSPEQRADRIRSQIQKLEDLGHGCGDEKAWVKFDSETEKILGQMFGATHSYLESYKYASLAEAEALVNLPEGGQEDLNQDLPQKAFQQRRQLLYVILADLEKVEKDALAGEDREDHPSLR